MEKLVAKQVTIYNNGDVIAVLEDGSECRLKVIGQAYGKPVYAEQPATEFIDAKARQE